jgi:hypothetical protein
MLRNFHIIVIESLIIHKLFVTIMYLKTISKNSYQNNNFLLKLTEKMDNC